MKKLLIIVLALFIGAGVYAQHYDENAEVRQAKGFHAISVSNAFDVYLTQSKDEAVAVSASETKYRDKIKVEVKDGVLQIKYENELGWTHGNKKLKAYISFIAIDKLTISGACDVFVSGTINAEDLVIRLSGASDLKGGKIEAKKLTVDLEGASDMTTSGIVSALNVSASGASEFRGFELVTDVCDAKASGASDIRVTVNKELNAHASGASDVHY